MILENKYSIVDKGTLYIVSSPIGNLSDITFRAIEILLHSDYILCESIPRQRILLNHYNIKSPKLISFDKFSEEKKLNYIIELLDQGAVISLLSDAGTPCINDPGAILVKHIISQNKACISVPGASAFLTLLTQSGLLFSEFTYLGFPPRKQSELLTYLKNYKNGGHKVLIFYESPMRINGLIKSLSEVFTESNVVIGRELTKKFETVYRFSLKEYEELPAQGEYVVILQIMKKVKSDNDMNIEELYTFYKLKNIDDKLAMKMVAMDLKISKNEVYSFLKKKLD